MCPESPPNGTNSADTAEGGELAGADSRVERVLGRLQHLLGSAATPADDGRSLERFVFHCDEDAFAELVVRHALRSPDSVAACCTTCRTRVAIMNSHCRVSSEHCLSEPSSSGNPNDRGASISSRDLILTPEMSRPTQSLFGLGPAIDSLTTPRLLPASCLFHAGPQCKNLASSRHFSRLKKSLLFVSYGLALLRQMRLTVHTG